MGKLRWRPLWWLSCLKKKKKTPPNAEDTGLTPGPGRFPWKDNPLQYTCLGNPMGTGAWRATAHGVAKESDTTQQINNKQKKTNLGRGKV